MFIYACVIVFLGESIEYAHNVEMWDNCSVCVSRVKYLNWEDDNWQCQWESPRVLSQCTLPSDDWACQTSWVN